MLFCFALQAEAFEKIVLAKPLVGGMATVTVEGWFSIDGVGSRLNLFSQQGVLELYAKRMFPSNEQPPLQVIVIQNLLFQREI
jgi:hypothetical protein